MGLGHLCPLPLARHRLGLLEGYVHRPLIRWPRLTMDAVEHFVQLGHGLKHDVQTPAMPSEREVAYKAGVLDTVGRE